MSSNNYVFSNENKINVVTSASTLSIAASQVYAINTIYTFTNAAVGTTITLPTAANLVAAHRNYYGSVNVNDVWSIVFYQVAAGIALTVAGGTGGTSAGGATAGGNGVSVKVLIRYTNVTAGAEAYVFVVSPGL